MVSKIRVLSDHTINKIAAGEVIENPSSVVKELVENSIDAGATEICVEIKGGGRQMIRISDNGCGMSPDDALLCLERHATSKMREVEEIHSLYTMGFRGEAIPSIAAVSKFTLLTTPETANSPTQGTLVVVEGGKIIKSVPAARSKGTTIEVKSLFFNVPVRKKFQKSPAYDANEILKILTVLALGHPEISFQLINQGKTELNTNHSNGKTFIEKLQNRAVATFGEDFLSGTRPVEEARGEIKIEGLCALPYVARNNRTGQYLFINKRPVFSPLVAFAVKEAYGTSLPSGKYPVFVLHLTVPGNLIDVNVHPQKKEVRIRQEQLLKELISKAIDNVLQMGKVQETVETHSTGQVPFFDPTWIFEPKPSFSATPLYRESLPEPPIFSKPYQAPSASVTQTQLPKQTAIETKTLFQLQETVSIPLVLGTIPRYILLDPVSVSDQIKQRFDKNSKTGLFIVDQKAAYARIVFERLQKRSDQEGLVQQTLLIPYTFDLTPEDALLVREHQDSFHQAGIHIQEFGQNTFIIDAVPEIFGSIDVQLLFESLLESLREYSGKEAFAKEKEKRIVAAATKAAVSHEKRYSIDEAKHLVRDLFRCQNPYQCPQGKSIIVCMSLDELAKQFLKV